MGKDRVSGKYVKVEEGGCQNRTGRTETGRQSQDANKVTVVSTVSEQNWNSTPGSRCPEEGH